MAKPSPLIKRLDAFLEKNRGRPLSEGEEIFIRAAEDRITYTQAIKKYAHSKGMTSNNIGYYANTLCDYLQNCLNLPGALNKTNFCQTLENYDLSNTAETEKVSSDGDFIGRVNEIDRLLGLLKQYKIVEITGIPGVGKTAIAQKLIDRLDYEFKLVSISLVTSPSYEETLSNLLKSFNLERIDDLFDYLKENPVVLFLDDAENILSAPTTPLINDPKRKPFANLFWQWLSQDHQGKLLLASRFKIPDFAFFKQSRLSIETYTLGGLEPNDAIVLLSHYGFPKNEALRLAEIHQFNPRDLIEIADQIRDFMNGDLQAYLSLNTLHISDSKIGFLNQVLTADDPHSILRKRVLDILSESESPIPTIDLLNKLKDVSTDNLLKVLGQLENLSLISKDEKGVKMSQLNQRLVNRFDSTKV